MEDILISQDLKDRPHGRFFKRFTSSLSIKEIGILWVLDLDYCSLKPSGKEGKPETLKSLMK